MNRPTFDVPELLQPYAQRLTLGDLPIFYYDSGPAAGTPLLLIHGLGDEADTWRHLVPTLARNRRVLALDLPGFGRSGQPQRHYTPAFYAATVISLLNAHSIERAGLIGSSMGAAIALRVALARPDLVERLVLLAGSLVVDGMRRSTSMLMMTTPGVGELIYTRLRDSQEAAYETLRPYYYDLDGLPEADRAFLRERVWARVWSDGQRRAYFSALRWMVLDGATRASRLRERLRGLQTPTHLIWGADDQVVPPDVAGATLALVSGARLDTIGQCGHLPHQERPQAVLDLIG